MDLPFTLATLPVCAAQWALGLTQEVPLVPHAQQAFGVVQLALLRPLLVSPALLARGLTALAWQAGSFALVVLLDTTVPSIPLLKYPALPILLTPLLTRAHLVIAPAAQMAQYLCPPQQLVLCLVLQALL